MNELERIAYHEAGHAVMYYYLCEPFKKITIIQELDDRGHTMAGHVDPLKPEMETEKCVLISLAGPAAEQIFFGKLSPEASDEYIDPCRKYTLSNKKFKQLECRAIDIIKQHKKGVEALAKELLNKRCFSGEEATAIIKKELCDDLRK